MTFSKTLSLFFMLMIFEGAIRKWGLPSLGVAIQVFRDILPAIALLQYINRGGRVHNFNELGTMVSLFFYGYLVLAILESLNPMLPSSLIGVLGLRTHFAYVPLIILMPVYLGDVASAIEKMNRLLWISIPVCILAVYQTTQPFNSWINVYGSGEASSAVFGLLGIVRASGTFSYITGMAVFSQFVVLLSLVLYSINSTNLRYRLLALAAMVSGIAAAVSTGSRGAVIGAVMQIFLFLLFQGSLIGIIKRFGRLFFIALIISPLVVYLATDQIGAFMERSSMAGDDVAGRIYSALFGWLDSIFKHPFGAGLGAGHQQAATLIDGTAGFQLGEEELTRIASELGFVGFMFFALFRFAILLGVGQRLKQCSSLESRTFLAFSLALLLPLSSGAVYTPITNSLYWSAIGVVIWAYRLDNQLIHKRRESLV